MKFLVAFALAGLVAGKAVESPQSPVEMDYHGKIGIPVAARLKAAEEAQDFDGSRIVGGSPAALGQHPYVGGLLITLTNSQTSVCTSSLLSTTRAVTAAHCWSTLTHQASFFTLVLGSLLLFSGGNRIITSDVEQHRRWNGLLPVNDVAIIRFPAISLTNTIQPIAIATGSNSFVGSTAYAAGFGVTRDDGAITTNQFLSHVAVQVVDNSVCTAVYTILNVRASTLCTSTTGGRGTCGGDSGGPLVLGNQLVGITSFGHREGCEAGHPAGFMRVTSFADWIRARL
ncbi:brachyurin-like [Leguminivora glycinivorella]|uniref:brachyurin-like n=1 Tax=Leguminivora glycinivorella TaxID=1035111 RepID=UPI002010985C|nr:brachyurin-like [Leguminivora glycinivorella]